MTSADTRLSTGIVVTASEKSSRNKLEIPRNHRKLSKKLWMEGFESFMKQFASWNKVTWLRKEILKLQNTWRALGFVWTDISWSPSHKTGLFSNKTTKRKKQPLKFEIMLRFPLLYLPAVDGAEEAGEETIKLIALTFFILLGGEPPCAPCLSWFFLTRSLRRRSRHPLNNCLHLPSRIGR